MSKFINPQLFQMYGIMAITRHTHSVFLLLCLQVNVLTIYGSDTGPLVTLTQGRYRGNFVTSPSGEHVAEYLGIPFAKPPVGRLRLANPVPVDPVPDEIFDAKRYAPSCPQVMDTQFGNFSGATMWNPPGGLMSEDCLYLNVWVPQGNARSDKTVMVWIYGGGFFSGSTALDIYNGKTLAAFGDVIIVSISYRLGALGFLSTGDERIIGNFGLMDQLMGLTWVQDNIRAFGGDANKVTIFGESAGGNSVLYNVLSPQSNGLFKRAIIQSYASDTLVFSGKEKARKYSQKFIKNLNCRNDNTALECLRKQHFGLFLREQWFGIGKRVDCPFNPTISSFLPEKPEVTLRDRNFNKKDVLLGANRNEATYFMVYRLKSFSKDDPVSGQTQEDANVAIAYASPDLDKEQKEEVFNFYLKNIDASDLVGNRDAIDSLYGDRYFACPALDMAESNAEVGGNTYFYYYNHRASNEVWPAWTGVMHAAEIAFIFGLPLNESRGYTRAERRFSERVMTYWVNFAKSGNPNSQGNSPWPKYTSGRKEYIELALRERKHEGGYKESECRFWDKLLNSGTGHFHGQLLTVSVTALVSLVMMTS